MEQRTLRLGDMVDDYCPRERRITNHAVVALVGDEIRQTRCTTCDVEHVYKQARVPKRVAGSNADGVTDNGSGQLVPKAAAAKDEPVAESTAPGSEKSEPDPQADHPAENGDPPRDVDGWLAHRPLIRAQLPRIEGHKEERRLPEFTIRQRSGNGHFRGGESRMKPHRPAGQGGNGHGGGATGNRPHGGPRFAGPRPAGAGGRGPAGRGGPAAGFRSGRKRSR